jgi:hypothetical protein
MRRESSRTAHRTQAPHGTRNSASSPASATYANASDEIKQPCRRDTIIEIRRYVISLGLYGQGASRERWELWIKPPDGTEEKHVAACRSMPARRGHHVVLALEAGAPVGLFNFTSRVRANFAQADPASLYRPSDIAVPVGLLFLSLFAAALVAPWLFLVAVPAAALYIPLLVMTRWLSRHSMRGRVEKMPDQIEREASQPTSRRQS